MLWSPLFAQQLKQEAFTYEQIEKRIDKSHDKSEIWRLILYYIQKSKKEKNNETLFYAYRYASGYTPDPLHIKYADSALAVAIISKNKKLLTNAYINKSTIYMGKSMYNKALDNILIANRLSTELNDDYTLNKTRYYIAQNKIYLGQYEEANAELVECINYFKKNLRSKNDLGKDFEMYYLYSLMSLIDSNTLIGRQEENKGLLIEAFEYVNKNQLSQYLPYFISSEGTDAYYNKNYNLAIEKLNKALSLYNDQWPHITEIYYLGSSFWKLEKRAVAIKYFEEIDRHYSKTHQLDPEFRSAYEILIKYNDSLGNTEKQLDYINKLMLLDDSYERNFKYLYTKINKEYDTQKLLAEKRHIEEELESQRYLLLFIILVAFGIVIGLYRRYENMRKVYEMRFNEIMYSTKPAVADVLTDELRPNGDQSELEFYNKIPGINPVLVEEILKQLRDFETNQEFLDVQVSKTLLSERFGTNPTYLSKIINVYKGKNFTNYVNDLRLDFVVDRMKNDWKFANKDVKELAQLAGFTNTESFSKNFQRKFQIKPSYFINMLNDNPKTSFL